MDCTVRTIQIHCWKGLKTGNCLIPCVVQPVILCCCLRHQKIRQEENYLESHLFQYERVEDVNQPIPSRISQPDVVDDKENYIESQLFRYQRKEIPNVKTDWQKNKPMVISKKTHGQDFYGYN